METKTKQFEGVIDTIVEKPSKVSIITEKSIIAQMMGEYFIPHRAWSMYGMDVWWHIWEVIKAIMKANGGFAGAIAPEEVEEHIRESINAFIANSETQGEIIPSLNRARLAHIDAEIDKLQREKASMLEEQKAHPDKY